MSKKLSKFLLFSAVAGAAAYGAYYYLQKKDQASASLKEEDFDDDFDDFSEDLDDDLPPVKERSYVSLNLDKAEAFATEAFQKAKVAFADSVQQVKDTVKSVTEGNSKDIIVDVPAADMTEEPVSQDSMQTASNAQDSPAETSSETADTFEAILEEDLKGKNDIPVHIPQSGTVEEFFDDEEV